MPSPSRTTKISSSAEWQCGGPPCVPAGMSRADRPVRSEPAALPRSRSSEERHARRSRSLGSDVLDVDDRGRPLGDLPDLGLAGCRLALHGSALLAGRVDVDERRARSTRRRRGAGACSRAYALPNASTSSPSGPAWSVCASSAACGRCSRRAAPRSLPPSIHATPAAAEDVEDLLLASPRVRRRRPPSRVDLDSRDADHSRCRRRRRGRARSRRGAPPRGGRLHVVPVRDERISLLPRPRRRSNPGRRRLRRPTVVLEPEEAERSRARHACRSRGRASSNDVEGSVGAGRARRRADEVLGVLRRVGMPRRRRGAPGVLVPSTKIFSSSASALRGRAHA